MGARGAARPRRDKHRTILERAPHNLAAVRGATVADHGPVLAAVQGVVGGDLFAWLDVPFRGEALIIHIGGRVAAVIAVIRRIVIT